MEDIATVLQSLPTWPWYVVAVIGIWSVAWKGVALWKAARKTDKVWFIALLLINTAGILEILYLYIFSKEKPPAV